MSRTIIINGRFLAAPNTGVQRVARELVQGLDRSLFRSRGDLQWRLVYPAGAEPIEGLSVIASEPLKGPPGMLWEQVAFTRLARQGLLVNLANTAPVAASGSVVMVHDAQVFDAPDSYSKAFRAWYKFMLPRVCKSARRVLTVSHHSAERLAAAHVIPRADAASVIHNGVDHILRTPPAMDVLKRHGLMDRQFLLGFASAQPHKNTRLLLHIAQADIGADMCVALVGSALPEGVSAPPRVKMLGRVTDAELRALYGAALAFLLPSTTEGFGLPAGEAMMCGAPVMTAEAGALKEIWAGGAAFAAPDRPEDWVSCIRTLINDPRGREQLQQKGAAHAAAFTWDAAGASLRQVCEEAA